MILLCSGPQVGASDGDGCDGKQAQSDLPLSRLRSEGMRTVRSPRKEGSSAAWPGMPTHFLAGCGGVVPGDSGDEDPPNLQDTQQTLAGPFPTAMQSLAGI